MNGICLILRLGCSEIGCLYLCWIYIFKWFLKFLLIFGKCICGFIFFDFKNFELLIFDNCNSCGVLKVLLDKIILFVWIVCFLLFFLKVMFVIFLLLFLLKINFVMNVCVLIFKFLCFNVGCRYVFEVDIWCLWCIWLLNGLKFFCLYLLMFVVLW